MGQYCRRYVSGGCTYDDSGLLTLLLTDGGISRLAQRQLSSEERQRGRLNT